MCKADSIGAYKVDADLKNYIETENDIYEAIRGGDSEENVVRLVCSFIISFYNYISFCYIYELLNEVKKHISQFGLNVISEYLFSLAYAFYANEEIVIGI